MQDLQEGFESFVGSDEHSFNGPASPESGYAVQEDLHDYQRLLDATSD